jgi:hypothetical protein
MSLRSSELRAQVRFTAEPAELLRRREMTRCANGDIREVKEPPN